MRTALVSLAYLCALGLGLFQTFRPTWVSGFALVQTERGDGMLNHYILEHSWQVLVNPEYPGSLFSPPCFYPEPATLWYSEHMLGAAPAYWGLRLIFPAEASYQAWQILLTALNFAAFALVLRWLRSPHAVAILGGYLWAFGLVHIDQIKHQQMIPRFWVPLALYHAWAFVIALRSDPRGAAPGEPTGPSATPLRHLAGMLGAVFFQSVSCVYTGWFLATGLATFLPVAVLLRPGGFRGLFRFLRVDWLRVGIVVGVWGVAMAAAFVPYVVVNRGVDRSYVECLGLIPTASAWLTGPPGTIWEETTAPWRLLVNEECRLFCGFGVYLLVLLAAGALLANLPRRSAPPEYALATAALLVAVVWVALTLTHEPARTSSLWEYARHIPGGKAIRCVSRVYITVYGFGTLAALVWLARVTARIRPPVRDILLAVVAGACIVEQQGYDPPAFEKPDFYPIADRVAVELRKGDAGYVVPRYTDTKGQPLVGVYGEVLAMWAGLRANVPVVNGYSGRVPGGGKYPPYGVVVTDDMLRDWLAGKFRGRLVVVIPDDPGATRIVPID
jgi:hypothetical protein